MAPRSFPSLEGWCATKAPRPCHSWRPGLAAPVSDMLLAGYQEGRDQNCGFFGGVAEDWVTLSGLCSV